MSQPPTAADAADATEARDLSVVDDQHVIRALRCLERAGYAQATEWLATIKGKRAPQRAALLEQANAYVHAIEDYQAEHRLTCVVCSGTSTLIYGRAPRDAADVAARQREVDEPHICPACQHGWTQAAQRLLATKREKVGGEDAS